MSTTTTPLPPALPGRLLDLQAAAGRLAVYLSEPAGEAAGRTPLLLVHSVNAAVSAREMRPVWQRYAAQRPVIAFDLPGFGLSGRGDRAYTPRLMTDALHAVAQEAPRRCGGRAPDLLALSLPLWSAGLFRALTQPGVIRFFLEKTWGSRAIDEDLWQYDVAITRAPDAR